MRDQATSLRLTGAAFAASTLTSLALFPVLAGSEWFLRTFAALVLVAMVGAAARAARLPRPLIPAAQAAVALVYLTATYAREAAYSDWLPSAAALAALRDLASTGLAEIDTVVAPLAPSPAVTFLAVAGAAAMAILVDALAASYRLTALAGLPLVVLYVVPAAVLPDGLPGWLFLLPAVGYLLLLVSDSRERLHRWGFPAGSPERAGRLPIGLGRLQRRVGVSVLALSVGLPALAPGLSDGAFGAGGITSDPGGGGTISTLNPLVSLRRDLVRPEDVDLMRVRTSSARPQELYLRAVTLDTFDGEEWRASRRSVGKFDPDLPDPPGLGTLVEAFPVDTTIEVLDTLASDYVPLPYPATRLEIDGAWRLDELTGNVVSQAGEDQITGASYRIESRDVSPSKDDVTEPIPDPYLTPYVQLPDSLPGRVRDLAERVTAGAEGPLEQGIALQQWFRDPANFTYDLRARPGTGQAAILDFLDDRRGYCEQFASTLAVMARHLGIPARVNVGFTAGDLADDGLSRVISARDAHAWPELWLPGIGWVRFEPTPGSASSSPSAPSWLTPRERPANDDADRDDAGSETTRGDQDLVTDDQDGAGGGVPDEPACNDPNGACSPPLPAPGDSEAPADGGEPWRAITALVAAGLLLLAIPAAARVAVRRRRFSAIARPDVGVPVATEVAWQELHDSIIDCGQRWPEARTPRQTAAAFAAATDLDETCRAALAALTAAVEQSRYARASPWSVELPLRDTVQSLRRAMAAQAGRRARLQAIWWPRSLFAAVQILLARLSSRTGAAQRTRLRGLRELAARAR